MLRRPWTGCVSTRSTAEAGFALHDPPGELGARAQIKLGEDTLQVCLSSTLGNDQLVSNLAVGHSACYEVSDLRLARRQWRRTLAHARGLYQSQVDRLVERHFRSSPPGRVERLRG